MKVNNFTIFTILTKLDLSSAHTAYKEFRGMLDVRFKYCRLRLAHPRLVPHVVITFPVSPVLKIASYKSQRFLTFFTYPQASLVLLNF